ncbi:MAG: glycosyltransferase, partial [Eubacterium sp.]|nr:glycosyltransferase [Eubacterium sp.]
MKFLLTCGGTAGHINPAIAIADALRKILPDCEILFVGSGRELENKLIPMQGYPIRNITITGFSRSRSLGGLRH